MLNVNPWLMAVAALGPAELVAPVTPTDATVHSYWVPTTVFGFVKLMVGVPPSQIVNTVLLIPKVGLGSTVITTSNVAPLQPLAVGVIV